MLDDCTTNIARPGCVWSTMIVESKNLINKVCYFDNGTAFQREGIVMHIISPGVFVLHSGHVVLGQWLRKVNGKPVKVSIFK